MNGRHDFAIWITGLPASGKSSITRELVDRLNKEDVFPVVLESDAMRTILTPKATYLPEERDRFYFQLAQIGAEIVRQGTPVIFDATANRRTYRDQARTFIKSFVEVFVQCPLEVCESRDPKGIYTAAVRKTALNVPGVQAAYEPPQNPDLILNCLENPKINAETIVVRLRLDRYI